MERERLVLEMAREAGFDLAGLAPLGPPPAARRFEAWLEAGHHGDMAYLVRQKSRILDPRLVLGSEGTLLVLGLGHSRDDFVLADGARVARYAAGRDYHNLMGKRVRKLARRLEREGLAGRTRSVVDAGPLLERSHAAAAGLGFESKAATPTTWDVIYNLGGATEFEVITDVYSTSSKPGGIVNTTNNTLSSSLGKWIKLGFLFDPNATKKTDGTNSDRIKFFVNGEPCNPATAIINDGSSDPGIASSNFPDGRGMFPSVVLMNSGGGDANMDVDWIRCAQFFPAGTERAPAV